MCDGIHGLVDSRHFKILQINRSLLGRVAPLPAFLDTLPIRCQVEGNEQEQVRAEDGHSGKGGEFFSGALALVWQVGEVFGGEVGVRGEIHEA